jgi:hypothetical protein
MHLQISSSRRARKRLRVRFHHNLYFRSRLSRRPLTVRVFRVEYLPIGGAL